MLVAVATLLALVSALAAPLVVRNLLAACLLGRATVVEVVMGRAGSSSVTHGRVSGVFSLRGVMTRAYHLVVGISLRMVALLVLGRLLLITLTLGMELRTESSLHIYTHMCICFGCTPNHQGHQQHHLHLFHLFIF